MILIFINLSKAPYFDHRNFTRRRVRLVSYRKYNHNIFMLYQSFNIIIICSRESIHTAVYVVAVLIVLAIMVVAIVAV